MLVAVLTFVLAIQSTPVRRLSLSDVQRQIANDGPEKALVSLFGDGARWDGVLKGVASGEIGWLGVAATLRSVSDAHSSETLDMAIQEALPKNPAGVLRLLSRTTFTASQACGMYGFWQIEDERPRAVVLRLVDRRIKAVRNVRTPELVAGRDACLGELHKLRHDIQGSL